MVGLKFTVCLVALFVVLSWAPGVRAAGETGVIEIDAVVSVSPDRAFDLWTNVDTVKKFFSPDAKIDPKVGGRYEAIFEPESDPQGRDYGTHGCKILKFDRGRHLAFAWKGPPWATEMNVKPYPTRVDVRFEPDARWTNRTRVSLVHSGYGTGGTWERSYEYFERNWSNVLVRFEAYCAILGHGSSAESRPAAHERRLESEVIVAAPIEQVWSAWTTSQGMTAFFAPQSKIELAIGGPYELYIKPDSPEGSRGCEGCTVLSYQPMKMLSFSWSAPPSVPALRDANIRTRVVLYFDDLNDGRVKVTLNHLGFGEGEDWDRCYAYFEKAWPYVLGNLKEKIEDVPSTAKVGTSAAGRVLQHEITLPASIDDVWDAFTTVAGIEAWMVPRAYVDIRTGGTLITNYNRAAEPGDDSWIMQRILTFDPKRMFSMKVAKAPKGFPHASVIENAWSVILFEPLAAERTRVVLTGLGYDDSPEADATMEFFDKGNAWTLKQLYKRFATGEAATEAPPAELMDGK